MVENNLQETIEKCEIDLLVHFRQYELESALGQQEVLDSGQLQYKIGRIFTYSHNMLTFIRVVIRLFDES